MKMPAGLTLRGHAPYWLLPTTRPLFGSTSTASVDRIASDHAPPPAPKRNPEGAPPGVPGLESPPLMLTVAARLSAVRRELLARNPRRIFNLPEQPETWKVDPEAEVCFSGTPQMRLVSFEGMRLHGRVTRCTARAGGRPRWHCIELSKIIIFHLWSKQHDDRKPRTSLQAG